jgi:hypothetical protein
MSTISDEPTGKNIYMFVCAYILETFVMWKYVIWWVVYIRTEHNLFTFQTSFRVQAKDARHTIGQIPTLSTDTDFLE